VDLVRRFGSLHLDDVAVSASSVVANGDDAVHRCLDISNVLQMAETVGAIDRVFEFTLEWAFDRHTFGRPLASYQELKHRFADMKLWLEASKATVTAAAGAVARGASNASELVSAAKSYVSEHAPELVQDCVQMHGGIGVTWDHDIHLYLRRVTLNSSTYGTARDHRERLATMILNGA
jgi:alkylation response protein AidB-like acyl-CoA dehydrogenase